MKSRKRKFVLCIICTVIASLLFTETAFSNSMDFGSLSMSGETEYVFNPDMSMIIAYDFLQNEMGFSRAVASGIIANLAAESGIRTTALGDGGTSFGICQWHNERWFDLISFSELIGRPMEDIRTQLLFFRYELLLVYSNLYKELLKLPDSEDGSYRAAYLICTDYESPANAEYAATNRGAIGISTYNMTMKEFSCSIPVMEILYILSIYRNGYTDPFISVNGEPVIPAAQDTWVPSFQTQLMTYDESYWESLEAWNNTDSSREWPVLEETYEESTVVEQNLEENPEPFAEQEGTYTGEACPCNSWRSI